MTFTYLQSRNSLVVASPAPTTTQFSVTASTGAKFSAGAAMVSGYTCTIFGISGDVITLAAALPFPPVAGDELVQAMATQRDHVRLMIGDTDSTDPQLQDEEIAFLLGQDPAPLEAAIAAADVIAARYARQVDFEVNANLRMSLMQKQTSYQMLADRLRRKIARRGIVPYVGGTSISERCSDALDTDLVQPIFQRGMDQEPGTDVPSQPLETGQPFPY